MSRHLLHAENLKAIVFTGPPASGKSTVLPYVRAELENRNFRAVIVPESASELIGAGFSPVKNWLDNLNFQRHLFHLQYDREELYAQMLREEVYPEGLSRRKVLLLDRGLRDAITYMGMESFEDMLDSLNRNGPWVTAGLLLRRYSMVIHLEGTAKGMPEAYTRANNASRTEDIDLARSFEEPALEAWLGHQYHVVIPCQPTPREKAIKAFNALTRVIPMPMAFEKERKFIIPDFNLSMIPAGAVRKDIFQTYLTPALGQKERRVRRTECQGSVSYSYAIKNDTAVPGKREETDLEIERSQYRARLAETDPKSRSVSKTRYVFFLDTQKWEIDVYHNPIPLYRAVAEAEVEDLGAPLELPTFVRVENEVTGDERYSNHSIALGVLDPS